jgi:hypothetical protein
LVQREPHQQHEENHTGLEGESRDDHEEHIVEKTHQKVAHQEEKTRQRKMAQKPSEYVHRNV